MVPQSIIPATQLCEIASQRSIIASSVLATTYATLLVESDYNYLDALAEIFSENRTVVANALNVHKGEVYNWRTEIADEYDSDEFGDLAVGGRYPPIIPNLREASKNTGSTVLVISGRETYE